MKLHGIKHHVAILSTFQAIIKVSRPRGLSAAHWCKVVFIGSPIAPLGLMMSRINEIEVCTVSDTRRIARALGTREGSMIILICLCTNHLDIPDIIVTLSMGVAHPTN
jgi:hypothetical protein